jgi:hypothetical protein
MQKNKKQKFYGLYKAITVPTFKMNKNEVLKCDIIQDIQLHVLNDFY